MKRKMLVGLWMSLSISLNAMMSEVGSVSTVPLMSESENKCTQAMTAMIGQSSILVYHRNQGMMYTPTAIKNTRKLVFSMVTIKAECAQEMLPPMLDMYREALESEIKTAEFYMKILKLKTLQD